MFVAQTSAGLRPKSWSVWSLFLSMKNLSLQQTTTTYEDTSPRYSEIRTHIFEEEKKESYLKRFVKLTKI